MFQGPFGVQKKYQGVAEQPWGFWGPMVVHARTPNNVPPPEGPDNSAGPPINFVKLLPAKLKYHSGSMQYYGYEGYL